MGSRPRREEEEEERGRKLTFSLGECKSRRAVVVMVLEFCCSCIVVPAVSLQSSVASLSLTVLSAYDKHADMNVQKRGASYRALRANAIHVYKLAAHHYVYIYVFICSHVGS